MVSDVLYRDEQLSQLSKRLNIPKTTVLDIWNSYLNYLWDRIYEGFTVKFLNVCYIRVDGRDIKEHETLAYISTEISYMLNISKDIVFRVLSSFEEYLIENLRKYYGYCIKGLVRIRYEKVEDGYRRVRAKKSTIYNGLDVTVIMLGSFKRKVEMYAG